MMKRGLRALAVLLCISLAPFALAQEVSGEAELTQPLCGTVTRTEGDFAYCLPQLQPQHEADEHINRFYQDQAEMLLTDGSLLAECDALAYRAEHLSQRYASFVFSRVVRGGNGVSEVMSADTFARDGVYVGQRLTLSRVLGMENPEEGSSPASELVYRLIWETVERDAARADGDYPEGVSEADVRRALNPETDFYLDQDGNIVFFIQAGELAGDIAGILLFPFSAAELLSAADF